MIMCLETLEGYFGRDRTLEKVTSRFFWEDMYADIREFVKSCDKCQRANDTKFAKIDAVLHPIAVESKVWNQVGCVHLFFNRASACMCFFLSSFPKMSFQ